MYFPVFRGKQYELIALRELSGRIAVSNIMPVIEPIRANPTFTISLGKYVEKGMPFCMIMNPKAPTSPLSFAQMLEVVEANLEEYENWCATLYVDSNTSAAQVNEFVGEFAFTPHVFFILSAPSPEVVDAMAQSNPEYVLLQNIATEIQFRFATEKRVFISDPFRQRRNADYPPSEPFSTYHRAVPHGFTHYGDYSIVGDRFSETGGAPYAVAIHYMTRDANDNLELRHYVSDQTESQGNTAEKFLEALTKLCADIPSLGPKNRTSATPEFESLYARQHFPQLGVLKKLGIRQHLELLLDLGV
jgi:hypothetical protein